MKTWNACLRAMRVMQKADQWAVHKNKCTQMDGYIPKDWVVLCTMPSRRLSSTVEHPRSEQKNTFAEDRRMWKAELSKLRTEYAEEFSKQMQEEQSAGKVKKAKKKKEEKESQPSPYKEAILKYLEEKKEQRLARRLARKSELQEKLVQKKETKIRNAEYRKVQEEIISKARELRLEELRKESSTWIREDELDDVIERAILNPQKLL